MWNIPEIGLTYKLFVQFTGSHLESMMIIYTTAVQPPPSVHHRPWYNSWRTIAKWGGLSLR